MTTQKVHIRQRLGAEIARSRVALDMTTQSDLAKAAALGLRTIVAVESGDKVSDRTLRKIEAALGWPPGTCERYLAGVIDELPAPGSEPPATEVLVESGLTFTITDEDRDRWQRMSPEQITEEGAMIGRTISPRMQLLYLRAAFSAKAGTLDPERT
ncbi:MAG: helix-turn-helix domain-containing protein [Solirubrobacteraceae bacterium]